MNGRDIILMSDPWMPPMLPHPEDAFPMKWAIPL